MYRWLNLDLKKIIKGEEYREYRMRYKNQNWYV